MVSSSLFRGFFALVLSVSQVSSASAKVRVGADLLLEKYFHLIKGKRVGLVTNHSAVLSNGKHLVDVLFEQKDVTLVALFGPEHGVRGDAPAGKKIEHGRDEKTGVPVYSLYGAVRKPTEEMLKDVDVLIFDIQDVGTRFYTYSTTLILAMEAAAERHIPYLVLDRPNPIGGLRVEGPVREGALKSFVGWLPVPIAHGLTVGELATLANEHGWLGGGLKADLTVVKMEGWKRGMWYDQTGLRWIKPSPNIVSVHTTVVYPGTCLMEGTNVSEGRGTERPFEYIGAPWIDGRKLAEELNSYRLKGIVFEPVRFVPKSIPGVVENPKYKDVPCGGVYLNVTSRDSFESVKTGIYLLYSLQHLFPDSLVFRELQFDRLTGVKYVREMLKSGKKPEEIISRWQADIDQFLDFRKSAFLYPE